MTKQKNITKGKLMKSRIMECRNCVLFSVKVKNMITRKIITKTLKKKLKKLMKMRR